MPLKNTLNIRYTLYLDCLVLEQQAVSGVNDGAEVGQSIVVEDGGWG